MVEAWNEYETAVLYELQDDEGKTWHWAKIYAAKTFTKFSFQFEDSPTFSRLSDILFYPLQWTRMCVSISPNITSGNSTVRMVADGKKWHEESWLVKNKPENLNLKIGIGIGKFYWEQPGRHTNLNIFSSALPVEQMISMTSPGKEECGLEGDFISWERSF